MNSTKINPPGPTAVRESLVEAYRLSMSTDWAMSPVDYFDCTSEMAITEQQPLIRDQAARLYLAELFEVFRQHDPNRAAGDPAIEMNKELTDGSCTHPQGRHRGPPST